MSEFQTVLQTPDLGPGHTREIEVHGDRVLLVNLGQTYHAVQARCPETGARLELRGLDWGSTRAFAHPAENQGYVRLNLAGRERDGIVAQGWYQQGTRFLDVSDPTDIRQIGYFVAPGALTWAAHFAPTDPAGRDGEDRHGADAARRGHRRSEGPRLPAPASHGRGWIWGPAATGTDRVRARGGRP